MPRISDSRILIIATDGFEDWELFGPRQILQQRGAEVVLASPKTDPIQGYLHDDPSKTIRPDMTFRCWPTCLARRGGWRWAWARTMSASCAGSAMCWQR